MIKNVTVASTANNDSGYSKVFTLDHLNAMAEVVNNKRIPILIDFCTNRLIGYTNSASVMNNTFTINCTIHTNTDIYESKYIVPGFLKDNEVVELKSLGMVSFAIDDTLKPIGKA